MRGRRATLRVNHTVPNIDPLRGRIVNCCPAGEACKVSHPHHCVADRQTHTATHCDVTYDGSPLPPHLQHATRNALLGVTSTSTCKHVWCEGDYHRGVTHGSLALYVSILSLASSYFAPPSIAFVLDTIGRLGADRSTMRFALRSARPHYSASTASSIKAIHWIAFVWKNISGDWAKRAE